MYMIYGTSLPNTNMFTNIFFLAETTDSRAYYMLWWYRDSKEKWPGMQWRRSTQQELEMLLLDPSCFLLQRMIAYLGYKHKLAFWVLMRVRVLTSAAADAFIFAEWREAEAGACDGERMRSHLHDSERSNSCSSNDGSGSGAHEDQMSRDFYDDFLSLVMLGESQSFVLILFVLQVLFG